jgi:hypothetical protein
LVSRWTIELSDEIRDWYLGLAVGDRAVADRVFELVEERGPMLRIPHSRSLGGDLFELRFSCEQVARRITYTFDRERRVVTFTTFRKQRDNEAREIKRARAVLKRYRDTNPKGR